MRDTEELEWVQESGFSNVLLMAASKLIADILYTQSRSQAI
jgi:hypothetical protein